MPTSNGKSTPSMPVKDLRFDPENPRLASFNTTGTQASIQKVMEEEFDLQPLADSLYRSGYFVEEPLVVVRERLAETKKVEAVVVEGNRRLAALRSILENPSKYPNDKQRTRLSNVPVIFRPSREELLPFLGFRHITGIKEWGSPEKAKYAMSLVESGKDLNEICLLIGDKTRQVSRLVRTESLVREAAKQGVS